MMQTWRWYRESAGRQPLAMKLPSGFASMSRSLWGLGLPPVLQRTAGDQCGPSRENCSSSNRPARTDPAAGPAGGRGLAAGRAKRILVWDADAERKTGRADRASDQLTPCLRGCGIASKLVERGSIHGVIF